jgi:type II secretory pathway predicted ATPase ExeA
VASSILTDIASMVLETARLGIVRGPVGIGKTYALRLIADHLTKDSDKVLLIEAPSEKSQSVRRFYQNALFDMGYFGHGGADPFEVFLGHMLRSYPGQVGGERKLLIVDECQRLGPNILETIREAYDAGQIMRDGDSSAPAFGVLLVGNHHFMTKGGRSVMMTLDALMSRCPVNHDLGRPQAEEYAALSAKLFPGSKALQDRAAKFGAKQGNLRQMAEAAALAHHYAGSGEVAAIHLEKAILLAGGAA